MNTYAQIWTSEIGPGDWTRRLVPVRLDTEIGPGDWFLSIQKYMHRYAQIYVYMHGYSSDTHRYWRIYTWYKQICTDMHRYAHISASVSMHYLHALSPCTISMHYLKHVCRYRHMHRYGQILTDIDRYWWYKQTQILTQVFG